MNLIQKLQSVGLKLRMELSDGSLNVSPPGAIRNEWRDLIAKNARYIKIALAYDLALAAWDDGDKQLASMWVEIMESNQEQ